MNEQTLKGNWKQLKGRIQEQWGKLTDDELDRIAGQRKQLVGLIEEKYGESRETIDKRIDALLSKSGRDH